MARDSVGRTFLVAAVLCIVCSVLVSSATVLLRPWQTENKELDRKRNILEAAGLYDRQDPPEQPADEIFEARVTPVLINLETGKPVEEGTIDPANYDQREAARNPQLSEPVNPPQALPGISRREKYAFVYKVSDEEGNLSQVVFPVYGKGLWSTLYGFIAVKADGTTVNGITFYEHAETPGLGGEVDNPAWKSQWPGKKIYNDQWEMAIEVVKGQASSQTPDALYEIDGLSGATITTRGVSNLVRYWLGENGFGPFLENLRGNQATAANDSRGATDG
jgi:Na+-transporting NADH:ubiquinone oxidoreductase subunit C